MNWFHVHRDGPAAIVQIGDQIGIGGQTAEDFAREIGDATSVLVNLSSNGGSVPCALPVAEVLRERDTTVCVHRRAFSAAIPILLAARRRTVRASAMLMIHGAIAYAYGGQGDLLEAIERLKPLDAELIRLIHERTGRPLHEVAGWIAEGDHYFTAEEAVAAGLADEIEADPQPAPGSRVRPGCHYLEGKDSPCPWTPEESLLLDLLIGLGRVPSRNRERLGRELQCWFHSSIKDEAE